MLCVCVCGDTIQAEVVVLCLLIALVLTHSVGIFTSIKTSSLVRKFDRTILCEKECDFRIQVDCVDGKSTEHWRCQTLGLY